MRRISKTTPDELIATTAARYAAASKTQRGLILDEFASMTGFHRNNASRVLREGPSTTRTAARPSRRLYDEAMRQALALFWEASDRVREAVAGYAADAGSLDGAARTRRVGTMCEGWRFSDERCDDRPCASAGPRQRCHRTPNSQ